MLPLRRRPGLRIALRRARRRIEQVDPAEAAAGLEEKAQVAEEQRSLPAKCPSCGGPIRSDEVNWIDPYSAECAYCGDIVKAT